MLFQRRIRKGSTINPVDEMTFGTSQKHLEGFYLGNICFPIPLDTSENTYHKRRFILNRHFHVQPCIKEI